MSTDPADRLMAKVRDFTAGLDGDERALFAALLAPGIAKAVAPDDEVEGFGLTEWMPRSLPDDLAAQIRGRKITIEGL